MSSPSFTNSCVELRTHRQYLQSYQVHQLAAQHDKEIGVMADKTAIFFDIGGVLLTNGWDHNSRHAAAKNFSMNWDEFENKHKQYADALDMGMVSVSTYLDKVVFDVSREFSKTEFYEFMKAQSIADDQTIAIARALSLQKKYSMATLNNESTDLNLFRIEKFGLGAIFPAFLSSCYLGLKKPDPAIYIRALLITNKRPEETLFIDDREENLEAPRQLGISVVHFQSATQLAAELKNSYGIEVGVLR